MATILQLVAVIILIIFYGCYFWKMFFQKKQGIKTDQLGKGKVGFVKIIEIVTKISTLFVVAAEIFSIFMNWNLIPLFFRIFGVVTSCTGTGIFITSVLTMGDSWRAGVPEKDETKLITNGIYKFSRNPAFLGFDLLYIGILLMFFNWLLLSATVFTIIMLHLQIVNVEEDFLLTAFGNDYLEYRKKVCRYIGRRK